jgi:hypothetical protein
VQEALLLGMPRPSRSFTVMVRPVGQRERGECRMRVGPQACSEIFAFSDRVHAAAGKIGGDLA